MSLLETLPPPDILAPLDFEALYQQRLAQLRTLLPGWDAALESDPAVKLVELLAYIETLDNARENDAILSNLLAFATGSSLDQLASFWLLARLDGESDERFRARLELHIRGLSGMGTIDYYRSKALEVGIWVLDARVDVEPGGQLHITCWFAPDAPVDALALASAWLTDDRRRMATDKVRVAAAVAKPFQVVATLYRDSQTPVARVQEAADALAEAIRQSVTLGRDIATTWLTARLMLSGITRIQLAAPLQDVLCSPTEYPELSGLTITDGGLE